MYGPPLYVSDFYCNHLSAQHNPVSHSQSEDVSLVAAEPKPREDDTISPTISWMAEETAHELSIRERGQLFSAWNDKRRRLREC